MSENTRRRLGSGIAMASSGAAVAGALPLFGGAAAVLWIAAAVGYSSALAVVLCGGRGAALSE